MCLAAAANGYRSDVRVLSGPHPQHYGSRDSEAQHDHVSARAVRWNDVTGNYCGSRSVASGLTLPQAVFLLFNSCPYPRNIVVFYFLYIFSLFVLFARFYVQSYFGGNTQKRKGAPRRKTA